MSSRGKMSHQPPKLAQKLLRWFCKDQFIEEVEWDLEELFEERAEQFGLAKARLQYWSEVLKHARPFFLKSPVNYQSQNSTAMLSNHLKIAFRSFWRSKVISSINVLGLSLGLASCMIVFFHVKDELSYDQFLENGENVYRVLHYYPSEEEQYSAGGPVPLGPTLKADFPGIKESVRLWRDYLPTLKIDDNVFQEPSLIFTDSEFFNLISFPLVQGDRETVLNEPNAIVLTERMALKYFGKESPMGKQIKYDGGRGELELKVTGIMKDLPHNTHFKIDFLASFLTVKDQLDNWGSYKPIWTYVTLEEGVRPEDIERGLPEFTQKYVPSRVTDSPGYTMVLEPMDEIYMKSKAGRNMKALGDLKSVYAFAAVGISILLIACINFINLTMAQSLGRAKEVGIRKTIGAKRGQVVRQFVVESGFTVLLSVIVATGFSVLFLPIYNEVSGKQVLYPDLLNIEFLGYTLALLAAVGLIAGIYPALFVSRFKASSVLKRSTDKAGASLGVRKVFVVFQFLISAILVMGILVTRDQMTYMYSKPLGINKENVLVIPSTSDEEAVLGKLRAMPEVLHLAFSQRLPVNTLNYDGRTFRVEGKDERVDAQSCVIDLEFLETYDIELLAGRDHFKGKPETWEFLINESAVKTFGFGTPEQAIGKKVFWSERYGMTGPVIGVFKDFHLESLHEKIPPMVMFRNANEDGWQRNFISIRYSTDNLPDFLSEVEDIWTSHNPESPYQNFLISDSFEGLHEADHRFATIFNYIVVIALSIACLGLLGLSMLTVVQRMKEIGIRKALGATVSNVTLLLSRSFLKLIIVGIILAGPLAYVLMENWLSGFSYRIDIGIGQFLIAFLIVVFVSLFTMGFQTLRAAKANPVDSLRDE